MKIVFMGTPMFAVPTLKKLIEQHNVCAVFTQPDKPKGRGKKFSVSDVKKAAMEYGLEILQPVKLKNDEAAIKRIKEISPDYIIVVAYGQILPAEVLNIPAKGCINLHASLLPKLRGAAPINWAIINGEEYTGNTTMLMDVGLDTGDMLLTQKVKIAENTEFGELHDILMEKGADLVLETIDGIEEGIIKPIKQDSSQFTYAPRIDSLVEHIDWNKTAFEICNLVRGLSPKPGAYTNYNDLHVKILKCSKVDEIVNREAGTVKLVSKSSIFVQAKDGTVSIDKLQFPGGKPLTPEQYLRGNSFQDGIILF